MYVFHYDWTYNCPKKFYKVVSVRHIVPFTFCEANNLGALANLAQRASLCMLVHRAVDNLFRLGVLNRLISWV